MNNSVVEEDAVNNSTAFIGLQNHYDYEILPVSLYIIHHRTDVFNCREFVQKTNGYVDINLNNKQYRKHRLIPTQFIENPILLDDDYINRSKTDYHFSN